MTKEQKRFTLKALAMALEGIPLAPSQYTRLVEMGLVDTDGSLKRADARIAFMAIDADLAESSDG